jgi:hypothetical protein
MLSPQSKPVEERNKGKFNFNVNSKFISTIMLVVFGLILKYFCFPNILDFSDE